MPVKSRGGKRLRKSPPLSGRGERREDEHVRPSADAPEREKDGSETGGVPLLREKGAPIAALRKPGSGLRVVLAVPGVEEA